MATASRTRLRIALGSTLLLSLTLLANDPGKLSSDTESTDRATNRNPKDRLRAATTHRGMQARTEGPPAVLTAKADLAAVDLAYRSDQVMVAPMEGHTLAEVAAALGGAVLREAGPSGFGAVSVPAGSDIGRYSRALRSHDLVDRVLPMGRVVGADALGDAAEVLMAANAAEQLAYDALQQASAARAQASEVLGTAEDAYEATEEADASDQDEAAAKAARDSAKDLFEAAEDDWQDAEHAYESAVQSRHEVEEDYFDVEGGDLDAQRSMARAMVDDVEGGLQTRLSELADGGPPAWGPPTSLVPWPPTSWDVLGRGCGGGGRRGSGPQAGLPERRLHPPARIEQRPRSEEKLRRWLLWGLGQDPPAP